MTEIGAMFEKEKEEAVADAIALTQAQDLVESVDEVAKNLHITFDEACAACGISAATYNVAKKYIALAGKKEPVTV